MLRDTLSMVQSAMPHRPMRGAFEQAFPAGIPQPMLDALMKVLQVERLDGIYQELAMPKASDDFLERMFARFRLEIKASPADLENIPKKGPVVAVANHPFGIIEGAALAYLLPKIRPDVKIMANFLLGQFPELERQIIAVDPFGGPNSRKANLKGMRASLEWLEAGGMLVVFPAGEVSHLQVEFPRLAFQDSAWNESIARLLRHTDAAALPLFVDGRNSMLFHLAGLVHPKLRTALLPHELLNKQSTAIELRCGAPISPARIREFSSDEKLTQHLRWRTYLLGKRDRIKPAKIVAGKKIASAIPVSALLREVQGAPLVEAGEYQIFATRGYEMPAMMREIGRLREETFRKAGEGTGKELDLDRFDRYYHHLFLWNKEKQELVGAYRLGLVDEILAHHGVKGLYTHTLFAFERSLLDRLGPAVELGRSFIRPEYQRSFQPLLMLWKGIGRFVLENSPAHVLFGPVSVSAEYTRISRELMASVLSQQSGNAELSKLVRPRKPLKSRLAISPGCDIEELGDLIADLEPDRKSIPVLLRQYLKLGGQLISFNVDPKFNHCLDGLIVVDLKKTDVKLLERYMGADGARKFLNENREGRLGAFDGPVQRVPFNRLPARFTNQPY